MRVYKIDPFTMKKRKLEENKGEDTERGCVCMYVCVLGLGRVQLFATPWTVAYQTPLSVGLFRQEYFCGLPFPTPRDLLNHGSTCISVISCTGITAPPGKPRVGR